MAPGLTFVASSRLKKLSDGVWRTYGMDRFEKLGNAPGFKARQREEVRLRRKAHETWWRFRHLLHAPAGSKDKEAQARLDADYGQTEPDGWKRGWRRMLRDGNLSTFEGERDGREDRLASLLAQSRGVLARNSPVPKKRKPPRKAATKKRKAANPDKPSRKAAKARPAKRGGRGRGRGRGGRGRGRGGRRGRSRGRGGRGRGRGRR